MASMRPSPRARPQASLFLVLLAALALGGLGVASASSSSAPAPLTAVGDVHGDFDDFVALLQHSGIIDAQHHWSAEDATLVQTGDLLDRGPKPREVMDLLMSLQKEAGKKHGQVVALLGNHEVMNIMGDLRYVTAENFASFADKNSEKRRHSAYRQYADWRKDHSALLATIPQAFPESSEEQWLAQHPAGFLEHREAFSPEGKYGKWLRGRPAVVELDHIVFLHGGIDTSLAFMSLADINRRVQQELASFDRAKEFLVGQRLILPFFTLQEITAVVQAEVAARQNAPRERRLNPENAEHLPEHTQMELMRDFLDYGRWLSVASNGPLWFRGYDQWDDQQVASSLPAVLAAYHAAAIVVGHTPQRDGRIRSRLGGKLFLIDTGMLSSYFPQGRASALEIRGATNFTAEYMDQNVALSGDGK